MKKLLLLLLLPLFFSCSNNNGIDDYNSLIIGTWNGTVLDAEDPTETGNATIIFESDGTGSDQIVWSKSEDTFYTFSWSITPTMLTFTYAGDGPVSVKYRFIDDDTLDVFSDSGIREFSYTLQRVE